MTVRGAFHPGPGDAAAIGRGTLVLIGNAGAEMWRAFEAGRRKEPDPLDTWTARTLGPVAESLGATALYPFGGPPHWPFQRWAIRAGGVDPSPIGPLIHAKYGLWHAYRAAFVFPDRFEIDAPAAARSPCDSCTDRPCLGACPVSAFSAAGYDVPACARHIGSEAGGECLSGGCLARLACPVGVEFRYAPAQAEFHMRHFLAAVRRPS
ncbi:MAG: hypothetical protein O2944_10650 [Proteobacteria bacterium]|nr:hypothetical protein [Pseudomonadota bacterium]